MFLENLFRSNFNLFPTPITMKALGRQRIIRPTSTERATATRVNTNSTTHATIMTCHASSPPSLLGCCLSPSPHCSTAQPSPWHAWSVLVDGVQQACTAVAQRVAVTPVRAVVDIMPPSSALQKRLHSQPATPTTTTMCDGGYQQEQQQKQQQNIIGSVSPNDEEGALGGLNNGFVDGGGHRSGRCTRRAVVMQKLRVRNFTIHTHFLSHCTMIKMCPLILAILYATYWHLLWYLLNGIWHCLQYPFYWIRNVWDMYHFCILDRSEIRDLVLSSEVCRPPKDI